MRKLKLFKTLLVAAGLTMGASAWATTYSGTVSVNAQNRITNNNNGTFTTAGNAGNQYALALADLSSIENIGGATSVTLDFDCTIPSGSRWLVGIGDKTTRGTTANGSSKSTYNTDGLIMRFGTTDGSYYRVNGGGNNSNAFGVNAHCTFTLDVVNHKYSYTIKNGETELFSASNVSTSVTAATIVEFYSWLGNATISISDVSYSFEYEASSYTYTVNAVDENDNVLKVIDTGLTTESSITVAYPYAIKNDADGFWYTTSAATYAVNISALNPTANITYTKDESIVGFYEGESVTGDNAAYSNGGYGSVAAQNKRDRGISAGTLTPGTYQFVGHLVADGNSGRAITIREGINDPMASLVGSNATKMASADFTVYATTSTLYINGANSGTEKTNLSTSFDYVLIKRTGDATVSVPVGTTGFATYANHDYALDFTNVSGLTAFTATVNGNEVTFTPATKVPAGTGVLLKGATADVPVIASAEAISDNILYAPTTDVTGLNYDADGYYNFILTQPAGKKIGFYRANNNSVAAGKAYLRVSQAGSRQFTFIGLDGETTTGIEAINTTEQKNGEVYNLQGQRMAKTQKGLYIVNGKKVIMK